MVHVIDSCFQELQFDIDNEQRGKLNNLKNISTSRECFRDYWNMRLVEVVGKLT